eukprot:gene17892-18124_t
MSGASFVRAEHVVAIQQSESSRCTLVMLGGTVVSCMEPVRDVAARIEAALRLIKAALPDAQIEIRDLAGDGDHYSATVISSAFKGKTRVAQHQMVYAALQGQMGGKSRIRYEVYVMSIQERIKAQVSENDVVVFMKGTPQFPMCGFSGQVVQILDHVGVPYIGVNVLEDAELRQGIKDFANWPTIPQLYVKGEFLGGCDIVREMFQSGELASHLTEAGIALKAKA